MTKLPVVWAKCCRFWEMPAPYWAPWGRCGECGQVPEFVETIDPDDWPESG